MNVLLRTGSVPLDSTSRPRRLTAALVAGTIVELPRETASHLAKVLRARSGDAIVLFNGDGREFEGAIDAVRGSRVTASVGQARGVDRESPRFRDQSGGGRHGLIGMVHPCRLTSIARRYHLTSAR